MAAGEPKRGRLSVLHCPSCNAPVPLAEGDHVACPYCGASVELPETYRARYAAARVDAAGHALFARLGEPPGPLLRLLGARVYLWIFLLLLPFCVVYLSRAAWWIVLGPLERVLHIYLADVLSPGAYGLVLGGTVFAMLAPLAVLGSHGRRHALKRRALQAALAAKPPATPGGSSTCRSCGAPLSVESGELGVRCPYCSADNLVALPPDWIAAVKSDTAGVKRALASAAEEERKNRAIVRRGSTTRLALLVLLVPGYAGFTALIGEGVPTWKDALAPPRRFSMFVPQVLADDRPVGDRLHAQPLSDGHPGSSTLAQIEYRAQPRCTAAYCFAARHGEHLQLHAPGTPVTGWLQHGCGLPFDRSTGVAFEQHGDFAIPRSGYFELVLDGGEHCGALPLTLSIATSR